MRTRLLLVMIPAVICGCGRTTPFEASPAPGSTTGAGGGAPGCAWSKGPTVDVNDPFPGPFSGPAVTASLAVNAWDDAKSLFKGRFVQQSFDWHGNAGPIQLIHEFSGPPNWLFTATPQDDGSVLAGWTDSSWTVGTIDVGSASFDTLLTMTPSNEAMVDLFRSDDRLMIVSREWKHAYPTLSVQFVDNAVVSDKVKIAETGNWLGLAWKGALDELVNKASPDGSIDPQTTLIHLDPAAQPSRVETPLGMNVVNATRCPDGSIAYAGQDPVSGSYAIELGRVGVDHQISRAAKIIRAGEAMIGGLGPRNVGLLCTADKLFVTWEGGRWFSGLPEPGTNDGPVTDQLWFAELDGDSVETKPVLLDERHDGYDSHPQVVLDGDEVVVTWLRADRGPANHDVLTRLSCQ